MPKIKLYIATTLDGFIAREDGSLDWLMSLSNPKEIDHGYEAFFETIDIVVMGRKTYEEVLGFGVEWPYGSCKTYVLSSDPEYSDKTPQTQVLTELNAKQIAMFREKSQKNIWVIGGGEVITRFLNLGAIDEMILSVIPIILGKGIPLFPAEPKETSFSLVGAEAFETGVVNLSYVRK
jgi:dihydrofolate reductase